MVRSIAPENALPPNHEPIRFGFQVRDYDIEDFRARQKVEVYRRRNISPPGILLTRHGRNGLANALEPVSQINMAELERALELNRRSRHLRGTTSVIFL